MGALYRLETLFATVMFKHEGDAHSWHCELTLVLLLRAGNELIVPWPST